MIQFMVDKIPDELKQQSKFTEINEMVKNSKKGFINNFFEFFDNYSEFSGIPIGFTRKELFSLFMVGIKNFSNIKEKAINNEKKEEFNFIKYFEKNHIQNKKDAIPLILDKDGITKETTLEELKSKLVKDVKKYEEDEDSFVAITENKLYVSGINRIIGSFGSLGINSYNRKTSDYIKNIVDKECNNLEGFYKDITKYKDELMFYYREKDDSIIEELKEDFKHNYVRLAEIPIPDKYKLLDMWYIDKVIILKLEVISDKTIKFIFSSPFFVDENNDIHDLMLHHSLLKEDEFYVKTEEHYDKRFNNYKVKIVLIYKDDGDLEKEKNTFNDKENFIFQKMVYPEIYTRDNTYLEKTFTGILRDIYCKKNLQNETIDKNIIRFSYQKVKEKLFKDDLTFKDLFEINYGIIKDGTVFDGWCDMTNLFKNNRFVNISNLYKNEEKHSRLEIYSNEYIKNLVFNEKNIHVLFENDNVNIFVKKINDYEYFLFLEMKNYIENIEDIKPFYFKDIKKYLKLDLNLQKYLLTEDIFENLMTFVIGVDIKSDSKDLKDMIKRNVIETQYINDIKFETVNYLQNIVFLNINPLYFFNEIINR